MDLLCILLDGVSQRKLANPMSTTKEVSSGPSSLGSRHRALSSL